MNLIYDPWIPIQRKSGTKERIAPWQLTESNDPVISLNAPRPDFNGALMQFLIGLLQTAATPENHDRWLDWLEQPPAPEELKACFEKYANAFELESKKGSFMQDFNNLDVEPLVIERLLIDSAQENAIKLNIDHFVKRNRIENLCPACVATGLFTLQTNAPEGGPGHRTSIRGGGPLTTLVILDEESDLPNDLWRNLWLNVLEKQIFETATGNKNKTDLSDIFPWLAKARTSEKETGIQTTPMDANPLQMYWGMPRRIRIQWKTEISGHCDLCESYSENLISHYQSKNLGTNYAGAWQHPLSPYSLSKASELLAKHPQPGGFTYQHWLGFIEDGNNQFSSTVVKRYRKLANKWNDQFRLYVFGYDTKSAKIRCWYETSFPLFTIAEEIRIDFINRVQTLTETASEFSGFVRSCVKEAWFKRPGDAKGDTSFLSQGFFQHTEHEFYQALKLLQESIPEGQSQSVLQDWHRVLNKAAFNLFDYWAMRGDFTQANPRRIAAARSKLKGLIYSKKIKQALQLDNKQEVA